MTDAEVADQPQTSEPPPSAEELLDLSHTHPILLFDGVCNLCNNYIQFVIERDPEAVFRFAPLQSSVADRLLEACGYDGEALDSIVLVDQGEYHAKSSAVIRAGAHLGGIYRLLGPFRFVPRIVRDFVYDFVADRRYNWFGKRDQCMVPSPDLEDRFLAGDPGAGSNTGGV
jgi:predicted DCC family thiol-disulfide oxidoreductase YuxK